jgi:hypothetical protein
MKKLLSAYTRLDQTTANERSRADQYAHDLHHHRPGRLIIIHLTPTEGGLIGPEGTADRPTAHTEGTNFHVGFTHFPVHTCRHITSPTMCGRIESIEQIPEELPIRFLDPRMKSLVSARSEPMERWLERRIELAIDRIDSIVLSDSFSWRSPASHLDNLATGAGYIREGASSGSS